MTQADIDIVEITKKAKLLGARLNRIIKLYIATAALLFASFVLNMYKAYQADKAYTHARESLLKYEEGVERVEQLIQLMKERNRILAQQDSILAQYDNINR